MLVRLKRSMTAVLAAAVILAGIPAAGLTSNAAKVTTMDEWIVMQEEISSNPDVDMDVLRDSLESLCDIVGPEEREKYTASSAADFEAALDAAWAVLADEDAGRAAIMDATVVLLAAYGDLVPAGDKAMLDESIAAANAILDSEGSYIGSSIAGLAGALDEALAVYANGDAAQADVDAALANLEAALAVARPVGDVDGDGVVTTSDSTMILRYAAELSDLPADADESADVNGDGKIDTQDASVIMQIVAEKVKVS